MTPRPSLFDATPSPHPQRDCPRCHVPRDTVRRCRGRLVCQRTCVECGALLADAGDWERAWAWCRGNVGLLRQSIRAVRPDLARVYDAAEVVSVSLVAVVKAALGFDESRGVKFSSYAANGVKLACRRLPSGDGAVTGVDFSRVEARAG